VLVNSSREDRTMRYNGIALFYMGVRFNGSYWIILLPIGRGFKVYKLLCEIEEGKK